MLYSTCIEKCMYTYYTLCLYLSFLFYCIFVGFIASLILLFDIDGFCCGGTIASIKRITVEINIRAEMYVSNVSYCAASACLCAIFFYRLRQNVSSFQNLILLIFLWSFFVLKTNVHSLNNNAYIIYLHFYIDEILILRIYVAISQVYKYCLRIAIGINHPIHQWCR